MLVLQNVLHKQNEGDKLTDPSPGALEEAAQAEKTLRGWHHKKGMKHLPQPIQK